jgi:hypothetical protein
MKKLVVVLFLLITNVGLAQGSKPEGAHRAGEMHKHLVQKLNLSELQSQKVKVIQDKYKAQIVELKQSVRGQKQQIDNDMHQLRNSLNAKMRKILTEEQFIEYKKIQAQKRKRKAANGYKGERKRP